MRAVKELLIKTVQEQLMRAVKNLLIKTVQE